MVRFQVRWMKKHYKKDKEYRYKYHFMGFPARLNSEIEPRVKKDFEMDWAADDTEDKETIRITLTRDKRAPPQERSQTLA